MATKQWAASPGTFGQENVVEDIANSTINSSFLIAVNVNLGTTLVNDNGTTRAVRKSEVYQTVLMILEAIQKDLNSDFG